MRTPRGARRPPSRFTIVTPVFNGMPWLPAAIDSVIDQRQDVDVELIVLDGGSTDGSREWLSQQVRTVATLVFEPDSGQTDALMRGLRMASGEYLGWLNSDDLLEPGALRSVADALDAAPDASAVSGCCLQMDEGGALIGLIPTPPSGSLDGLLRYPNNLAQPATFFRAEAYRRCGGLDAAWSLAMDVDLWMKLARVGPIALLPDTVLARFRIHAAAKSVAGATAAVREDLRIRRRHGMPIGSRAWWVLVKRAYLRPVKWSLLRRSG
jgi:glycosyltransferase involved in cell wall biosynthesis